MDEMKNLEELAEENRRLKEENERLQNLSPKERLYEHIHVSVRTMNIIIGCLCALFVLVIILGMMK
ncbi:MULTISPECIES: hypothetical protein [Clostridia]|nr:MULTISPECIES: hypothetical protein [Clostridia]MCB7062525.1 hypothetical protein [Enterocloster citroniae]MCC8082877.1 hypothetical protein [Clostridium sp.]MCD8278458.1 hypothetical protein [Enterocloster citroniae]